MLSKNAFSLILLSNVIIGLAICSPLALPKAISLGRYNIAPGSVTTSGISSGAVMATQMHVIFSSTIQGAGIFAGVPYGCALGLVAESLNCMSFPDLILMSQLYARVASYDTFNNIDSISNIRGDKVYIFHGTADTVVRPGSGDNVESFYKNYGSQVLQYNMDAQHCQPTENYGGTCNQLNTANYMNKCSHHGAYEMLNYIYGNLIKPSGGEANLNNLFEFNQGDFFQISQPSSSSMDDIGYVYIPTRCASGSQCKLHVAFHGCQQGRQEIGNVYVVNGGYLEVAELNDIIVLFPQAIKSTLLGNPQGCWDWWGYNNYLYDTKSGNQVLAVKRMIDQMMG